MDSKLIARYLAGQCSEKEIEEVERLAEASPENRKLMKEYVHIWKASESEVEARSRMFDAKEDWKKLQTRIVGMKKKVPDAQKHRLPSKQVPSGMAQILRVAAVVLIASLIGVIVYQNFYSPPVVEIAEPVLREIITGKGQLANLVLSDGTKVQLNADSKLMLPTVFEADKREVFLEGEGYFEVAENRKKPFLINSGPAVVKILGTSLGVRSYKEDGNVSVVVREGKVSLQSKNKSSASRQVVLNPGQVGQLHLADNRISTRQVTDMELHLSWTEGYLKFKNMPMQEVVRQLERKYDIEVQLKGNTLAKLKLTAELKSRSLKNVLDVISTSLGVEYELNQQKVVFSEK